MTLLNLCVVFFGGLMGGFALGIWWVYSHRFVIDRSTHRAFLNTLSERTSALDRVQAQLGKMTQRPAGQEANRVEPRVGRLRIWMPDTAIYAG